MGVEQIDHIAVNRDDKANAVRKAFFVMRQRPELSAIKDRLSNRSRFKGLKTKLSEITGVHAEKIKAAVHNIEHHRAHLACSYFVSPFDSATVVSVDGFGDFVSTMWGEGKKGSIHVRGKVHFPHSLGLFYLAVTQYLGFNQYGDEYKVMGLAPYGKPEYMDAMNNIVSLKDGGAFALNLDCFRHHTEGVSMEWDNGAPRIEKVYSPLMERFLGPARTEYDKIEQRHLDIAASLQKMYEDAFFHVLDASFELTGNPVLCLAGGCAMNSVANGKVFDRTSFRDIYIQPAPGDGGGAIGAAFYLWNQILGEPRIFTMDHAYWGPRFPHDYIGSLLEVNSSQLKSRKCTVTELHDEEALCTLIAGHIAGGKVVGWFQGRMEFGPRALGNRSILCDPRRADMKDILNMKIKKRESFRPFAPSILREAVAEWYEIDHDVAFMQQVYQIKPEKQKLIPAVTHVDGSGRLHTVREDQNPLFYRLINSFEARTGIPLLLNTSFNENEPVVCSPEDALDCFLRTKMDIVVIGDWVIDKGK
jgi:carbamoyltransferase